MSFTPYRVAPPRKRKPPRTAEALDVAVRYFLYKLYDASPSTTSRSAGISGSISVTGTTSSDDVAQAPTTRPSRDLHTDFVQNRR